VEHPLNTTTVPPGRVYIHWFGQSSFGVKDAAGTVLMIDPYSPHERPAERFIHATPPIDEKAIKTDYVLFTHDHRDHTCVETVGRIAAAWPAARFCGPRESIDHIVAAGVPRERTEVIAAGESRSLGSMKVWAVWAKPPQGDPQAGIAPPDVTHLGYVIDAGGVRLYFSGDPINTFAEHDTLIEPIKALAPHIGMLTCHPTEGEFPYFDGSVKMARRIGLQTAVPSHYACFVKRNYDPHAWASHFGPGDPQTLIIPYNDGILYP